MSAITLAEKKIKTLGPGPSVFAFAKFLTNRYEVTDPNIPHVMMTVEDILQDSETEAFIKELGKTIKPNTTRKKKSTNDEGRMGQYNGNLCDARVWEEKPRSGGVGYDNIQCSFKKVDGCDCLCKKHFNLQGEGKLWTGLITEPRPEEPVHPTAGPKMWSTDADGNDVVKEKKKKKAQVKKPKKPENKSPEDMDFDELTKFMEDLKISKEEKEDQLVETATPLVKEPKKEETMEDEGVDEGIDEGYKEELNKEGQLVETAPPLDQVIGFEEEPKKVEEEPTKVKEEPKKVEEEPKKEPKKVKEEPKKVEEEPKKVKEEKKKEPKKVKEEKKKKFDITKFEPEPENDEEKDLELDDGEDSEDEEMLKLINIEGVEYQINFEDNTVISVDEFIHVGMWNPETESIDFDDDGE